MSYGTVRTKTEPNRERELFKNIETLLESINFKEDVQIKKGPECFLEGIRNINSSILKRKQATKNLDSDEEKLPEELECFYCKKTLSKYYYSKIQLKKYCSKQKFLNEAKLYKIPKTKYKSDNQLCCKKCNSKSRTHLVCYICSEEKLLSEFSKRQRKFNEDAKCLVCMKDLVDSYQIEPKSSSDSDSDMDNSGEITIDIIGERNHYLDNYKSENSVKGYDVLNPIPFEPKIKKSFHSLLKQSGDESD